MERKLTAILSADVKGYSRLRGAAVDRTYLSAVESAGCRANPQGARREEKE